MKSIDIGKMGSVREDFCYGLDDDGKVDGCYRSLADFLPLLASCYLSNAKLTKEDLLWFNNEVNTFHVVLGGDGAPFGKDDTACAWLVSFINRGKHILSSNENFLIFGSNCQESSVVVQRNVKFMLNEISEIEKKTFKLKWQIQVF